MQILQVGLSHQTTPVEIRERLALPEAAMPAALERLCPNNGCGPGYALEGAVLSTCNRLEIYAIVDGIDAGQRKVQAYLARVSNTSSDVFGPYLQVREDQAAVEHLCQVASGLDSLVLGESQIQGQVAEAHRLTLGAPAGRIAGNPVHLLCLLLRPPQRWLARSPQCMAARGWLCLGVGHLCRCRPVDAPQPPQLSLWSMNGEMPLQKGCPMSDRRDERRTHREYPGIYEKAVPIALGIVATAIIILLLVILAVALGLFPGI